jgi:hypothetical protein
MLQPMYISQQSTLHSPTFCLISDNPSPTAALAAAAATTQLLFRPQSSVSQSRGERREAEQGLELEPDVSLLEATRKLARSSFPRSCSAALLS